MGNTIFVHHPHCGGTAYLAWLKSNNQLYNPELHEMHAHASAITWQTLNLLSWEICSKVGIVRNPWDKLVSIYLADQAEFTAMQNSILFEPRYKRYLPNKFPDFLEWLIVPTYTKLDYRKQSQYDFFCDTTGSINYTILRFEKDLKHIPAMHFRTGVSFEGLSPTRPHYSTYYNELSKRWVDNFFKKDIETWNYCFETV